MLESPTIETIAKRACVAKSTVSLALRNSPKLLEATRMKIQGIAHDLGYKPNPLVSAQMAHIRRSKPLKKVTTIGFLNTWYDEARKKRIKWEVMGRFHRGVKKRSEELGFQFEPLEFDTSVFSRKRIEQILESRNIDGIVLSPLKRSTAEFEIDWSPYALASIGYFESFGNIHRVFYDNFKSTEMVLEIAQARGYKRIGFITNREGEKRAGRLWSAGFLEFQSRCIPDEDQIPMLRLDSAEAELAHTEIKRIENWYREYKPDIIVSFLNRAYDCLESIGLRSPEDFGYISLLWSKELGDVAGYCQCMEKVGATAVDIVADRLFQNNRGMPDYPSSTLLTGEFIEGRTLRAP